MKTLAEIKQMIDETYYGVNIFDTREEWQANETKKDVIYELLSVRGPLQGADRKEGVMYMRAKRNQED